MNLDKDYLLKKSKYFCLIPWTHIHTTPAGKILPCCISRCSQDGVGNTASITLSEAVNSPQMIELRSNMVNEIAPTSCVQCHDHEKQGIHSFRQSFNNDYAEYFDDATSRMNDDYTITDFKMRYFDVRFSNICNFKCRSCGSEFSSQWEVEDKKRLGKFAKTIPKNNKPELVAEVVSQISNIETAYFAGGEPLITEEHYTMLEEMIKQGRTDIKLRYNTNLSNFKFKDKDLLGLWKHFTNGVDIYASIDHYGERAEYIRSGTNWGLVESNLKLAKSIPHINTQLNTVVSLYNYVTFNDFYQYLIDKNLYTPKDMVYTIYNMHGPTELATHVLLKEYKEQGKKNIAALMARMSREQFSPVALRQLHSMITWTDSADTWDIERVRFKKFTEELDALRGESFIRTFPELAKMMD